VLELAILGVLKEQPLHGYELKKRLSESLGPLSSVSFGSLYPALKRLQTAGALEAVEPAPIDTDGAPHGEPSEDRDGRGPIAAPIPMTGSLGGEIAAFRARRGGRQVRAAQGRGSGPGAGPPTRRAKKVYRITEAGERLFDELLAGGGSSVEDDRGFGLRLAFARYLPTEARLRLLERRRAQLVEQLAKAHSSIRASREGLDSYTRSLAEHRTDVTERDISWLDQLIAAEREEAL